MLALEDAPDTRTDPVLQEDGWWFYLPKGLTAVGAHISDDRLLIVNTTSVPWLVCHRYHQLGVLEPEREITVVLDKSGTLSVRQVNPFPSGEYLLVNLDPTVWGVEIVNLSHGEGCYEVRRMLESELPRTLDCGDIGERGWIQMLRKLRRIHPI